MPAVTEHYANFLAPVYLWMAGGIEEALAQGARDLASYCNPERVPGQAIDLGAGFGMHAIPLARAGWRVTAIDSSACLLSQLRQHGDNLTIRPIEDDLLGFQRHINSTVDLVVCLGDTLTHLPDMATVETLFSDVAESMSENGEFILAFRDYRELPVGEDRFISVRSDSDRIHTCFLEALDADSLRVHDIIQERVNGNWCMRVSSYDKLRIDPDRVVTALEHLGFDVQSRKGGRGMVNVIASRDRAPFPERAGDAEE